MGRGDVGMGAAYGRVGGCRGGERTGADDIGLRREA